ncbi:hypothetical protein LZG00_14085 [Rhodobacteraceae bacterium LMO-12]|nr:hypothetical protein [Rhodobacteraceae bacterium LMO-JJ12]
MSCSTNRVSGLVAAGMCVSLACVVPASAGDGNIVFIEQQSTNAGLGNTLFVDQSEANNSIVAGDTSLGLTPATQIGGDNEARITLRGNGARVQLNQFNSDLGLTDPTNLASIMGGSSASIILDQQGFGNIGTLDVAEGGNSGALFQIGERNEGTVKVTGSNNSGTLYQKGNDNEYTLQVSGQDTTVQWNQIGNNLGVTSGTSVAPAQVFSNAGSVTITQISR